MNFLFQTLAHFCTTVYAFLQSFKSLDLSYKLRDIQEALGFAVIDQKWTVKDKQEWFDKFIKAKNSGKPVMVMEKN